MAPLLLPQVLKAQLLNFLKDNDETIDESSSREELRERVSKLLKDSGMDPEYYDFSTHRMLVVSNNAVVGSGAVLGKDYTFDLRSPEPFEMEPISTAAKRWDTWMSAFDCYIEATGALNISSERKRQILLHCAGPEVLELSKSFPENFEEDSYTYLTESISNYFTPRKNKHFERFQFSKMNQAGEEPIDSYISRLRLQAKVCEFNDIDVSPTDDQLLSRLISGCNSESLRQKLLQEGNDLSLDKALSLSRSFETSKSQALGMSSEMSVNVCRNNSNQKKNRRKPQGYEANPIRYEKTPFRSERKPSRFCKFCLSSHVMQRQFCRATDAKCHACKRIGHFAGSEECDAPPTAKVRTVQQPEENFSSDDNEDVFHISQVHDCNGKTRLYSRLDVAHVGRIAFLLDSGAECNILPKESLSEKSLNLMRPTSTVLRAYDQSIIPCLGTVTLEVRNPKNGMKKSFQFRVVESGAAILGLNAVLKMKLMEIRDQNVFRLTNQKKLTPKEMKNSILEKYGEVFGPDLGVIKGVNVQIRLKENAKPVFCRARPVPFSMLEKVENALNRAVQDGTLEKIDSSEWASPCVHVLKQNGDVRICSDFKSSLNPQIHVDQHPFPNLDELSVVFSGCKVFAKIDFSRCFEQLKVHSDSRDLLTINTHKGLFRHKRLPYGISCAPAICQRTIESILNSVPNVPGKHYLRMDDVLIGAKTTDDLLIHVEKILEKLRSIGARLNVKKFEFGVPKIGFTGHLISEKGVETDPQKCQSILKAPAPTNKTELKSFLGLVQYYARFCSNLSDVATPIRKLLRNDVDFIWSDDCDQAFQAIKKKLTNTPILAFYDPNHPLILQCDASPFALGCVLSTIIDGEERPIEYAHGSLSPTEQKYSHLDKEALSIVYGVSKFHKYLYGREFTILTDHRPLVHIFGENKHLPAIATARIFRWALLLSQYQYKIQYKPGSSHMNADYLSRFPADPWEDWKDSATKQYTKQINSLSAITCLELADETRKDPVLSQVLKFTLDGWNEHCCPHPSLRQYFKKRHEMTVHDGCLLWGSRVCIPTSLQQRMLDELHSSHPGIVRMKCLAREHCYWPSIDTDLERRVNNCSICQDYRPPTPPGKIETLRWPSTNRCWERIHIDYAPKFMGKALLILVDSHSHWVEIGITSSQNMSSQTTIKMLQAWFHRYGYPETLVSDNGTNFVSAEFEEFLKSIGTKHCLSAPGHPATNGTAERVVQTVKRSLTKILAGQVSKNLYNAVDAWLLDYRSTPHSATSISPAEIFLGRKVRTKKSIMKPIVRTRFELATTPDFEVGERVRFRTLTNRKPPWECGSIVKVLGARHFLVKSDIDCKIHKRHREQIIQNKET